MNINLIRDIRTEDSTLGKMQFPDGTIIYTLEPLEPIPVGTYPILVTYSPKFERLMPLVADVPGHSGIRIHIGNTAKDTSDCVLVGTSRLADAILHSRIAFNQIFPVIAHAVETEGLSITITENFQTETAPATEPTA